MKTVSENWSISLIKFKQTDTLEFISLFHEDRIHFSSLVF